MSHFTEVQVNFKQENEKDLIAALEAHFGEGHVEVHEEGAGLFGYGGDDRSKNKKGANYAPPCHIVIRRKHVGGASNDVGYLRDGKGGYTAYVSDFDKGGNYSQSKQDAVAQDYAERVSMRSLKAKGYTVVRKKEKDGTVHLSASKYSS